MTQVDMGDFSRLRVSNKLTGSIAYSSVEWSSDDTDIKRVSRLSQAFEMRKMSYRDLFSIIPNTIQRDLQNHTESVDARESKVSAPFLF